jgi:protein farnesyltransferase/geranylgeranyltransferase type-1 subunit alpha
MTSSSLWKFAISELTEAFPDVVPINVTDDEGDSDGKDDHCRLFPVASIEYTEAFRMAYGFFRAILHNDEVTWRALKLTATCLQLNPANYTVWHYRRRCLNTLHRTDHVDSNTGSSTDWSYVKADLDMAASLGGDNPKNYQIWYHRRAILEQLPPKVFLPMVQYRELEYVHTVLCVDAKNYHAWSHRQWVISNMVSSIMKIASSTTANNTEEAVMLQQCDILSSLWDSELAWVEQLLQDDLRNNSAWNYRWYVCHNRNLHAVSEDKSTVSKISLSIASIEMDYALRMARIDPYNESPWKYFSGILQEQVRNPENVKSLQSLLTKAESQVEGIANDNLIIVNDINDTDDDTEIREITCERRHVSSYLIGTLVDILEWKGDNESLRKAMQQMESLATLHDVIRRNYWHYRMRRTLDRISIDS